MTSRNIPADWALETLAPSLLRGIPEALVFCDLEGIIRYWNAGAEQVFGWSAQEAMGQSLDLIIPERMRKAHWDGFDQAIARGGVKPGRAAMMTRSLHKTTESIYVEMSFSMVSDATGALIGSLAVAREATARFTEEKALRKQLAELTAQK
ncbi:histidine kinase [Hylemonella gracilis str. Niagara R]|uniref:Histidine kinase n=1 Tax=Hylemonella gracilis str. Niagara R TaxID=1458275 RepID=A0A016XJX3_9BURK|nr:PAS domain-containing protein [Hylemonella gracilis]EYC52126.1 histidine kinase [Hylemonella gracilis str. Niagara R]